MPTPQFLIYPYAPCPISRQIEVTALHTAFSHRMKEGYSSLSESHDFWEIIVVYDGHASIVADDEAFYLSKNTLLIHPPLVFHRHFNSDPQKNNYTILSFSANNMPIDKNTVVNLTVEKAAEFRSIVRLIRTWYETDRICIVRKRDDAPPLIEQEIKSRIELFLSTVLFPEEQHVRKTNRSYEKIIEFLSENTDKNMSVPEIASALNMSVPNIKRVFKLYSGVGIMKYFNQLKFERAVAYLQQGYTVREVSEMLGFNSQSAFCTAFKNATGMPPSKYPD